MQIQVDAEGCTGCGGCIAACPNDALSLKGEHAAIDQASCAGCQTCIDVCPTGAISVVEAPHTEAIPVTAQPLRKEEVITGQPGQLKPWLGSLLDFTYREILPRLIESLTLTLERRAAQTQEASTQALHGNLEDGPHQRRSGQAGRKQRIRERGRWKGSRRRTPFRFTEGGEEHATW